MLRYSYTWFDNHWRLLREFQMPTFTIDVNWLTIVSLAIILHLIVLFSCKTYFDPLCSLLTLTLNIGLYMHDFKTNNECKYNIQVPYMDTFMEHTVYSTLFMFVLHSRVFLNGFVVHYCLSVCLIIFDIWVYISIWYLLLVCITIWKKKQTRKIPFKVVKQICRSLSHKIQTEFEVYKRYCVMMFSSLILSKNDLNKRSFCRYHYRHPLQLHPMLVH